VSGGRSTLANDSDGERLRDDVSDLQGRSFAALLQHFRRRAALSQSELAEKAGLATSAIGALERGTRLRPRPSTVSILCDVLGLSVSEKAALATASRASERTVPEGLEAETERPVETASSARMLAFHPRPLPIPLTPLVGRLAEVFELSRVVRNPAVCLATLTGVGGAGKTRLALAVAGEVRAAFDDGVCLVELAPVDDARLVLSTVARAVGVPDTSESTLRDALVSVLEPRELLLVLDNCEHVIQACAELVADLLAACRRLTIMATSRELLRIDGEHHYVVPPLTLPDAEQRDEPETLAGVSSVALFVARARELMPAFSLTSENAADVAAICRQLDGIPLAIELASSRARMLSPPQISARLTDGL
jgi:transcriptional regulator with XRE-family HTH domain